ncbi:membrane protein [Staphylococcus microti]|uniref:Membrane protein n=2 Tax=Staphylococcus TaxID=1279 RepID=A0A0D6XSL2_9STAP|nr:membrane protein [Staphylococcus microti]KIX91231.1 membrane protein [Staphylococcus microti]PNZ75781.1 hypothetical protein CD132_12100 [Staphylococcus microti]SUM58293.1 putative mating channel protein [Staphylococcus microti]
MKRKGTYLLCFLILPFVLLTSISAYAVSNPIGEPTRSVQPKIEKYDLSNYRSIYEEEGDWNPFGEEEISRQINNVTDFFFSMSKILVSITDYAIGELFNLDVLDEFGDKIGTFVADIYENLSQNLMVTLFVLVSINAFVIFSVQGNVREALRRGFLIFCLIGFGVGILANAGSIIRGTNAIGKDLNNIIMNSTSSINGNIDYVNENSGLNNIRNQYFDMTIYRTYLVMNYGTVNEKEIKEKGKDRIDDILKEKYSEEGQKNIEKIVKDEVDEKKRNNKYMTQGYVFQKLAISIIGFVITLFMSVVFLSISFAKLIFSTFALFLFIFLAFSWIISFWPGFEISVFKAFAKTVGYMILSTCMTFLFVIVGLCIDLANTFIVPDSQNAYFLNCIFVIVILIVLFKKRAQIISFVSRGNVSFSATQIGETAMRKTQDSWNAMRHQESQNKQKKRANQRISPEPKQIMASNPKRTQQTTMSPVMMRRQNSQQMKRRSQQQSQTDNGRATYHDLNHQGNTNEPLKTHDIQKTTQQDVRPPTRTAHKDIQRSPQTTSHYSESRTEQRQKRAVQSAYDSDIQKRQVSNRHSVHTSNQQIQRSSQAERRLKEQKEKNKHGE